MPFCIIISAYGQTGVNMKIRKSDFCCSRGPFKIHGRQYIPEGEKLPIFIVSHEFIMGSYTTRRYARHFSELGYAAFCYDFVGGATLGLSSGKHTDMTVHTEIEDLRAVLSYARSLPQTDSSRVYLMGCSQGGLVSALLAAELGDEISGLILFYPALCIPDDARAGNMIFNTRFDPACIPETIKCGPYTFSGEYPASVMDMDVYEAISKYKGPVFIAHGTKDGIVMPYYSQKAKEVYENCTMLTVPDAKHVFKPIQDRPAVSGAENFLAGRKEMLTVDVRLTKIMPALKGIRNCLTISFTGSAKSDYFVGRILPGAEDVQKRNGFKTDRLCAVYTLEGTDFTGAKCRIDIQNVDEGSGWKPTVHTDSKALAFLNDADCYAQVKQRGLKGPLVRIFAVPNT